MKQSQLRYHVMVQMLARLQFILQREQARAIHRAVCIILVALMVVFGSVALFWLPMKTVV